MNLSELIFIDEALNLQNLVKSDPEIAKIAATVATAKFNQYVPDKNGKPLPIVSDDNRVMAFIDALRLYIKREVISQKAATVALLKKTAMLQPPKAPPQQPTVTQTQGTPNPQPKMSPAKIGVNPFRKTQMAPVQ
jgi:hypothetical protein